MEATVRFARCGTGQVTFLPWCFVRPDDLSFYGGIDAGRAVLILRSSKIIGRALI